MTDVLSVLAIEDGDAEYCMAMNGLLLGYAWDAYDSAEETTQTRADINPARSLRSPIADQWVCDMKCTSTLLPF
eukprot:186663-Amphidinium_carterae.1